MSNYFIAVILRRSAFLLLVISAMVLVNACDDDEDEPVKTESVNLTLVTEGLISPLVLVESPDNTGRLFVVDQTGLIYIIKDGTRVEEPFLDVSGKLVPINVAQQDERGLLGLDFHPDFAGNGLLYVYYSAPLRSGAPAGWNHTSHISEFKVSPANADLADIASERLLLAVDQPQANHNGGMVAFGPDGYLYISLGDGGGANDNDSGHVEDWYDGNEGGNGQDTVSNLLGDILRIDVNTASSYSIPDDNPFVDSDGRDEIFAYGFRNPYRFCFDPNGQVIVADAGQELYEEIDLVTKGGNYGWNLKEGRHCFSAADPDSSPSSCPSTDENGNPLIDPVIEFKNSKSFSDGLGNVSIGGYVYHGDAVPELSGKYIFGVLTQDPEKAEGAVFAADRTGSDWPYVRLDFDNMDNSIGYVLGFGQDNDGEVYVLTLQDQSGKVYKIEP